MNRIKMAGLATVGALGLSVTGFIGTGTARADMASDIQKVVDNVPAAVDVLAAQVQLAIDHFSATQSLDGLVNDIGFAVNLTGGELGNGTEQFGLLGLGLTLAVLGPYQILAPYFIAFDNDPASVIDLLDPNDVSKILANIPAAIDAVTPQVMATLVSLLQGNLIAGTDLFSATAQPGLVGDVLAVLNALINGLLFGTTFEPNAFLALSPLLVAALVGASYVQQAEDALVPVFDALAPVTAPIIDALEG
jgi:hypothetical protein